MTGETPRRSITETRTRRSPGGVSHVPDAHIAEKLKVNYRRKRKKRLSLSKTIAAA
jgi:hypothetical protein